MELVVTRKISVNNFVLKALSILSSKLIFAICSLVLLIHIPITFIGFLVIVMLQILPVLLFLPNQIASVLAPTRLIISVRSSAWLRLGLEIGHF